MVPWTACGKIAEGGTTCMAKEGVLADDQPTHGGETLGVTGAEEGEETGCPQEVGRGGQKACNILSAQTLSRGGGH